MQNTKHNSGNRALAFTPRRKQYLLASAALALISLCHVSLAQANEWKGTVSNDFFDPLNWDDGQGPQGNNSVVNFGKPVGIADANSGEDYFNLVDQIGVIAGADAEVTLHVLPEDTTWPEVGLLLGDNTFIGKNGGKGKLNVFFDGLSFSRVGLETLTVGDGAGSNGEFNIIGAGKDAGQFPPEGPVIISEEINVEPIFVLSIDDMVIGKDGGIGVVNLSGSIMGFEGRENITIGQGPGSQGMVNVLSGGKFTDGANWTRDGRTPLMVGTNSGAGVFNVVGSGSDDRGDAPLMTLANGLILGDSNGTGAVNVLGGGKVHSYVNSRVLPWGVDPSDPSVDWSDHYTKLGVNGGTGEINVSGKGSVWYQSGITTDHLARNIDSNGELLENWTRSLQDDDDYVDIDTTTASLFVGESGKGSLSIADDGVVRIGTATFRYTEPRMSDEYAISYSLQDHKADGSLVLAKEAGSAGTLNIGGKVGAAATSAGRLMAKDIVFGEGTGLVRFNHTNTDYVFDEFDAKYLDGPSRAQVLQLKGKGTIEAASGRTIFNQDQLDFNGKLQLVTGGTLQVNGDMSGATADLNLGILEGVGTVGDVSNKGLIAPGKALNATHGGTLDSIGTLTVKGNYTGNGGGVLIDAVLGDDNSKADRLVITGNTAGNSTVAVRNIGGKGADTVEGIEIITVGGQSDGEFKLIGNYTRRSVGVVVAGAHTYKLHQGSVSEPTNGHWYLRSETEDEGYQAGIPVYEAYPQFLLGLNNLPTMQQRVGNRYWNNAGNMVIAQGADAVEAYVSAQEAGSLTQSNGVWGRIEGAHTKMEPNTSTTDADYDFNAYKMQAGLDGMIYENEQGKLIAGGTVHYTHGLASIWSPYDADLGRGRIKTDGYGFGATLTWAGDDGFYVDNQAQLTWYRSELSYEGGKSQLKDGKNSGFGYALSSEVAKRFTLDQHWSLTPQAQLQYSNVDFSDFTDVFGADVSRKKGDSLRGRLGLSVDYQNSWQNAQGLTDRSSVYGIVNLYNEFLSGTKVRVSTEEFINKSERFWGGIGLGGSYNWYDDKYSIYGEGSVNTSFKNFGDSYNYKGTLGVRVKW